MGGWRNWYTRYLEVVVRFCGWRFKSSSAHHDYLFIMKMQNVTQAKVLLKNIRDSAYYETVSLVLRVLLGLVFVFAAVTKIPDLYHFQLTVASYHILPLWLVPTFANVLPFVELALGVLLMLGLFTKPATWGIMFLLVVFIVATGIVLLKGNEAACGCFGAEGSASGWRTIARDGILLLLGAHILLGKKFRFSLDNWRAKRKQS